MRSFGLRPQDDKKRYGYVILSDSEESHFCFLKTLKEEILHFVQDDKEK
jgi:hypothetical protein